MRALTLIAVFFLIKPLAYADDWQIDRKSEVSLYPGFTRDHTVFNPTPGDQFWGNVNANTSLGLAKENLTSEFMPEIRSIAANSSLTATERLSPQSPARLLNLTWNANETDTSETVLAVERLNIGYRFSTTELSLGRKPVSLGVLSIFPIWNKFSRPLITDFGPLRIFGQDQASVRFQSGSWAGRAMDIEESNSDGAARLAEGTWYGENLELHALAGSLWTCSVAGIAAAKDFGGTSVRAEGLWIDSGHGWQVGAGAERAFNQYWSFITEFMYLEEGATNKSQYLTLTPSRFRILLAEYYGFARIEYKPFPLWVLQLGSLVNLLDDSELINAKATYSYSDSTDLSLELRLPQGQDGTELSTQTLPTQLFAGARWVF